MHYHYLEIVIFKCKRLFMLAKTLFISD